MTKQANKNKSLDPLRAKKGEFQLTKQAKYSIENCS